jgi:hypothetical protein
MVVLGHKGMLHNASRWQQVNTLCNFDIWARLLRIHRFRIAPFDGMLCKRSPLEHRLGIAIVSGDLCLALFQNHFTARP